MDVRVVDPEEPAAQHCLREYFAELDRRFDAGFDVAKSLPADVDDMRLPRGLFLAAFLDDEPVGSGVLKFHGDDPAELKRMWVDPATRGRGVARTLLQRLEEHAAAHGARTLRLETNRNLVEAIALYRTSGFQEVPPFNDEPYAHHWFEKQLR